MLPCLSSAAGESCIPTIWFVAVWSTGLVVRQEPSELSGDVATHTRVAATTLISKGPKIDAPQPPAIGAPRVPHTAYRRPVRWFTERLDGPPESAHWRSS